MRKINKLRFTLALAIVLTVAFSVQTGAQEARKQGTWKKFETTTERFEEFMRNNPMGDKYDSSMSAIKNVKVNSEAEAILVSDSSGVILTYTERTIFESSGFNSATFRLAWGPMLGRYPIDQWKDLQERTNNEITEWIKESDLTWFVEKGLLGAGAAEGLGIDITKKYHIGNNAEIICTPNSDNRSFIITITIPLEDYFNESIFFTINDNKGKLNANLSFHNLMSDILKASKLFKSDTFIMTKIE